MFFGRNKSLVGLDIGDSSIKAVELKDLGRGRGWKLVTAGVEPLSAEAIVDGAIMDSGLVSDTIQRLFRNHRIRTTQVATALSGHSVIIKRISMPMMSADELAESIQWEAEQYIPFAIEDVNLDWQVLDGPSLTGEGNMDVLLVAVKKERINDYVSVISQAGLTAAVVDIDAFALQNAFEANYEAEAAQTVALIDIGAAVTTITIMRGGTSVFWRDISMGGNQVTDAIQKELNLSAEQSERIKKGDDAAGVPMDSVIPVIASVSNDLGSEIQKTLDFYKATSSSDEPLERIFLTGGAAQLVNLRDTLAERFHIPVELMDPFRKIESSRRATPDDLVSRMSATAAVAVGLATRRAGDR